MAGLLWCALLASGGRTLLNYENTAGTAGTPPSAWPSDAGIERSEGKFVLVMLSHPDCPCTQASLAELETIIAKTRGNLVATILFAKPGSKGVEVRSSELWKAAARIPDVTPVFDEGGRRVKKFGGHVSGQTMLYDPSGRLVFSGGITRARGHQGANDGVEAVIQRVRGNVQLAASTPVFGCALHDPDSDNAQEDPSWRN